MTKKLDLALLLALLLPIFAVAPLVQNAGIPNVADGVIHLLRQVDFDHAFRDGALVPRWGADLYLGFGYPLYVFAPPLLAYLVETFHLVGVPMDDALKLVVIATLELYSVGMFLFMRPKVGDGGALIAAALNVYGPLRLREALVTGGNYPQFLAMALFPLILWAFDGIVRTRSRRFAVIAALSYAALILSHLFHALIFTPVVTGYVLMCVLTTRASRGVWALAVVSAALGVMLAAFFWLPTIAERSLTRTAPEIYTQSSDYHQRFLSWHRVLAPPLPLDFAEANADVPLALGWAQLAAGALGLLVVTWRAIRITHYVTLLEPIFFFSIFAVSIFLQLPASASVWENVALLPVAEFPWRFMGISAFALAALGGYASLQSPQRHGEHREKTFGNLCALCRPPRADGVSSVVNILFVVTAILTAFPYMAAPHGFVQLGTPTVETVRQYETSTGAFGLTTINEYLPQTVQELPADIPAPLSQPKIDLPPFAIISSRWSPRGERDVVMLTQPTSVRFRIFDYPGSTVYVDNAAVPTTTQRDGTFTVAVPAGEHRVETRFEETTTRLVADGVSVVTMLLLVVVAFWKFRTLLVVAESPANSLVGYQNEARLSGLGRFSPTARGLHTIDRRALAALVVLLVALFVFKLTVLDPQGWLRVTRYTQPLTTFDNQLELLGAQSDETTIGGGGELHARFFWRLTQPLQQNYHIIAQLISADGRAVAGSDKQHPGDPVVQGETPTTQIEVGMYVRDEHRIVIPPNVAAGRYELRVGLYDPQTGKRLKLPNGETLFTVGMVEVR